MALTLTKLYSDNTILYETHLDILRAGLLEKFNVTGILQSELQAGGLTLTSFAASIVDTTSVIISSNALQVKDDGLTYENLIPRTISLAGTGGTAQGELVSKSLDGATWNSTALALLGSLTIATGGGAVLLEVAPDGINNAAAAYYATGDSGAVFTSIGDKFELRRDGTPIASWQVSITAAAASEIAGETRGPLAFTFLDTGVHSTPGTYTYAIYAASVASITGSHSIAGHSMFAREIARGGMT